MLLFFFNENFDRIYNVQCHSVMQMRVVKMILIYSFLIFEECIFHILKIVCHSLMLMLTFNKNLIIIKKYIMNFENLDLGQK